MIDEKIAQDARLTEARGVICVDSDRKIVFFAGLGANLSLRSLATDEEWIEDMRDRRITVLNLNQQKFILTFCPLQDGFLVLIDRSHNLSLYNFIAGVDFAFDIFGHMITDPYDAMTVVDSASRLRFISPIHEKFFGLDPGAGIGEPVQQVIENTRLDQVVKSGRAEIGHLQHMREAERVVTRTPIRRDGRIVGAIGRVMFKGPADVEKLSRKINSLESEVEFYKREADALRRQDYGLGDIIGNSDAIAKLKDDLARVAPLDVPVLVTGESGVGKELVAQAIHRLSPRRDNPLVIVNAAALPATLVESELFGYSAGAFTGAHHGGHSGKFEQANKGTIFLDEIGDMPLEVQAKLLRVVQDNVVERLGGKKPIKLDFRLVTATNRDLEAMVSDNAFRLDLFYRIAPVVLEVPPLRNRNEDIEALATHFLKEFAARHGRKPLQLTPDAVCFLMEQSWPGNVRQLKHELERAAIFVRGDVLNAHDISGKVSSGGRIFTDPFDAGQAGEHAGDSLRSAVDALEGRLIQASLARHHGNKKKVAEQLEISRSYLYKRLAELDLN